MSTAVMDALFETRLGLPGRRQGKVRDVYEVPPAPGLNAALLIVATDRISAFDVVMPTPIPGKGRVLTKLSLAWFRFLRRDPLVGDHLITNDPGAVPGLSAAERSMLAGRAMVCRAAQVVPIECVVRGYLAGSGWVEYQRHGSVCGVKLPPGLKQCDRLPEPIFTPATKADQGHDENVSFDVAAAAVGGPLMERLRSLSIEIYRRAAAHALAKGIILADTKFEFGRALGPDRKPTDELLIVDEVLTPDSSRYWPAEEYRPGADQPSFDKQFLRNWLLERVREGTWDKTPPGPELPAEIVSRTYERYVAALERLAPGSGANKT